MASDPVLRIVDATAGGDVSRVIIDGGPRLAGDTVTEQCADFARRYDHLRLKLIHPPHGALHMCPVLLLPPRPGAGDFGAIIMESMGYPPISGSNLFCAAAVALEHGIAAMREPETRLRVETPAGMVPVTAFCAGGRCRRVEFQNTPAGIKRTLDVRVATRDATLPVIVVQAGVDYAVVNAGTLGIALGRDGDAHLIECGIELADAAGTDFVLFHEALRVEDGVARCDIAVYQAPGVICRSPTGTGTSAMLALGHARGVIGRGMHLVTRSPSGGSFRGRITGTREQSGAALLDTVVAGDVETTPPITIR